MLRLAIARFDDGDLGMAEVRLEILASDAAGRHAVDDIKGAEGAVVDKGGHRQAAWLRGWRSANKAASRPLSCPSMAERIVAAGRALSPHLGECMAAGTIGERPVIIRELAPEDLKLEMEQFSRGEAATAARYLAGIIVKAHGRQMTPENRGAGNTAAGVGSSAATTR